MDGCLPLVPLGAIALGTDAALFGQSLRRGARLPVQRTRARVPLSLYCVWAMRRLDTAAALERMWQR